MGLRLSVYRSKTNGDCTNHGISSKVDTITVVNVEGPFLPDDDAPAFELLPGPYNSVRLVPRGETRWIMYGGNIGHTSDSRFNEAVESLCGYRHDCIKIFDRIEH